MEDLKQAQNALEKVHDEELKRHRMELAHVGRLSMMGEMAANLAHELNQPLAALRTLGDAPARSLAALAQPAPFRNLKACREGAFSTEEDFMMTSGEPFDGNRYISDGDLLSLDFAASVDGSTGALVEVNCETDFVSKNESFLAFAKACARLVAQYLAIQRLGRHPAVRHHQDPVALLRLLRRRQGDQQDRCRAPFPV